MYVLQIGHVIVVIHSLFWFNHNLVLAGTSLLLCVALKLGQPLLFQVLRVLHELLLELGILLEQAVAIKGLRDPRRLLVNDARDPLVSFDSWGLD